MTAGVRRRVRVVIEGEAHEVSNRCEVLRIDLPRDVNMLIPTVMVNPSWEGVTVEDVTPAYDWQDGDVVQDPEDDDVLTRICGAWFGCSGRRVDQLPGSDEDVSVLAASGWRVLRYQAGAA